MVVPLGYARTFIVWDFHDASRNLRTYGNMVPRFDFARCLHHFRKVTLYDFANSYGRGAIGGGARAMEFAPTPPACRNQQQKRNRNQKEFLGGLGDQSARCLPVVLSDATGLATMPRKLLVGGRLYCYEEGTVRRFQVFVLRWKLGEMESE